MISRTVMITGGAGYIGSHAALALLEAGYRVVVLDNLSTGFTSLVPEDCFFVQGDAGDSVLISEVIRKYNVESVMHFAGSIIVEESVSNPLKYYKNNTMVSCDLVQACIDEGVGQFIFSSTAAVYGNPDHIPVTEEASIAPINPYGASKAMTEQILRDVSASSSLRYVALRYFNVAGADPQRRTGQMTKNATHLIKIACETALGKRDKITIYGDDYDTPDGTCIRDYIHVSDLASAHVSALEYLESGGQSTVLNCGYGTGYSVMQVLDTLQTIIPDPLNIERGPRRAGDSAALVANSNRLQTSLDWSPIYNDLKKIIHDALEWERVNGSCG